MLWISLSLTLRVGALEGLIVSANFRNGLKRRQIRVKVFACLECTLVESRAVGCRSSGRGGKKCFEAQDP